MITIDIIVNDKWVPKQLPTKFIVCRSCKGTGTSSAYLGAYTREDMDEAGPEFEEEYRNGEYDRACDTCKGKRVEEVVDRRLCPKPLLDAYDQEQMWQAEARQEQIMESRMLGEY